MKPVIISLGIILLILQYKIWFDDGGIKRYWYLKNAIARQVIQNNGLKQRNEMLKMEIKDLRQGQEAIEERARNDLGMVKKGETFYQIIEKQVAGQ